jgi:2-keto-4-pentenoate hydratase/2-oxohepta-3-ene-1,7-dioic acid hydratase in catechol pathway
MRRVAEDDAFDHVLGYTVANDISARDVQFADGQWVRGKSLDTFCPIGPVVVTADEVPDPQALNLRTRVNGSVVQESITSEMLFGVAALLSFCSASFTLEPRYLLLTGTPWGCGSSWMLRARWGPETWWRARSTAPEPCATPSSPRLGCPNAIAGRVRVPRRDSVQKRARARVLCGSADGGEHLAAHRAIAGRQP